MSDCKWVVVAVVWSFDVQVCEGEPDLEALWHAQVPLLQRIWGIRLGILRRMDLPMHHSVWVSQGETLTHQHIRKEPAWKQEVWSVCLRPFEPLLKANSGEQTGWTVATKALQKHVIRRINKSDHIMSKTIHVYNNSQIITAGTKRQIMTMWLKFKFWFKTLGLSPHSCIKNNQSRLPDEERCTPHPGNRHLQERCDRLV